MPVLLDGKAGILVLQMPNRAGNVRIKTKHLTKGKTLVSRTTRHQQHPETPPAKTGLVEDPTGRSYKSKPRVKAD